MTDDIEMAHANKTVGQQEANRKRKSDVYVLRYIPRLKEILCFTTELSDHE